MVNAFEGAEEPTPLDANETSAEPHRDTSTAERIREDAEIAALQDRLMRARSMLPRPETSKPEVSALDFKSLSAKLLQHAVTPERQAAVSEYQRAATARALLTRVREREIPADEDLRSVALDPAPLQTEAFAAFREALAWRGERRAGCVFILGGSVGRGKTCALTWMLLHSKMEALYVRAPSLVRVPRTGYPKDRERWERWDEISLLGLDDLGTEGGDIQVVMDLLWQRYDEGLCTLVTTNLARGVVVERYFQGEIGRRLADRLLNAQGRAVGPQSPGPGGLPWYVAVTGPSLRNTSAYEALRRGKP